MRGDSVSKLHKELDRSPAARVQRGESATARCASTEDPSAVISSSVLLDFPSGGA
jgi:hypothetical protein